MILSMKKSLIEFLHTITIESESIQMMIYLHLLGFLVMISLIVMKLKEINLMML
jgi:hypothetical protein